MPKIVKKQTREQRCMLLLVGNIKKHLVSEEVDLKNFCKAVGFTTRTFYNRLGRPELFTNQELMTIFRILKFTDSEILESLRG